MKLYVKNPENGNKIYLKFKAESRVELLEKIGKYKFYIDGNKYTVDDVIAEIDTIQAIQTISGLASGAIIGTTVLGIVGFPVGAILGTGLAAFGAKELLGNNLLGREKEKVKMFNQIKIKGNKKEIK